MPQLSTQLFLFFSVVPCLVFLNDVLAHEDVVNTDSPMIDVSGFATIAYAQTVTDDKKEGDMDGMTTRPELTFFNRLGLRFDSQLKDNLAFTLQMVANGEDKYTPKVDWAFAEYFVTNTIKLSAGKMRMPLYMLSEFKDVTYAYQWIVPPYAVYGSPNFASFNGIKGQYSIDMFDEWTTTVDLWTGRLKDYLNVGGIGGYRVSFDIEDMYGASLTFDRDWLSIRAVYMQGISTSDIAPVIISQFSVSDEPGVIEFSQELKDHGLYDEVASVASSPVVTLESDDVYFAGLGFTADFRQFFFSGEFTYIKSEPNIIVGRAISYYLLAGIRVPHDLSFSLTYAKDFNRPADGAQEAFHDDFWVIAEDVKANWNNPPGPPLDPNGEPLPVPSDALLAHIYDEAEFLLVKEYASLDTQTYILSSRWDFHASASLKAEYLYKAQTKYGHDYSPQAIRLALDLVF